MHAKKIISTVLAICLLCAFSACAAAAPAVPQAQPETPQAQPETPEINAAETAHFPVEITTFNFEGDEILTVYYQAPTRVVAIYQGSIETMIALGLEDSVIASFGLDNELREEWQASLERMNYDDSVFAPERETVIMLEPDKIFSWGSIFGNRLGDVYYWIESGVNTYINTNTRRGGHPRTVENEFTDILNIGRIHNVEYRARALVEEMQSAIDEALALAEEIETQRVAVIEFWEDGTIANYPSDQLGGNMVERLGGELAIPELSRIGLEDLLEADPDIIFVVFMERYGPEGEDAAAASIAKVMDNPVLSSLSAVQNQRVYSIMLGDMFASAVRTLDGIRTFASGMFPELASSDNDE